MSEIDINKMVEMAGEREGWRADGSSIASNGEFIAEACCRQDAPFIAQSPATILALNQQVQDLQAQNAALQAQVGAWQGVDVVPPVAPGWIECEVLVMTRGAYSHKFNDWTVATSNITPAPLFYRLPLPDDPTAAVSESES